MAACVPFPAPAGAVAGEAATLDLTGASFTLGNASVALTGRIPGHVLHGDGGQLHFVAGDAAALPSVLGVVFAILIFAMQPGFALLESGMARAQSVLVVVTKNTFDACFVALVWYLWGYAVAFGDSSAGGAWGTTQYALTPATGGAPLEGPGVFHHMNFFLQYQFAANAVTIVSGAPASAGAGTIPGHLAPLPSSRRVCCGAHQDDCLHAHVLRHRDLRVRSPGACGACAPQLQPVPRRTPPRGASHPPPLRRCGPLTAT